MNNENIENIKDLINNVSIAIDGVKNLLISINIKLESDKINVLKLQNQISIANHLMPEMEKEIRRLKSIIDNIEREDN